MNNVNNIVNNNDNDNDKDYTMVYHINGYDNIPSVDSVNKCIMCLTYIMCL